MNRRRGLAERPKLERGRRIRKKNKQESIGDIALFHEYFTNLFAYGTFLQADILGGP